MFFDAMDANVVLRQFRYNRRAHYTRGAASINHIYNIKDYSKGQNATKSEEEPSFRIQGVGVIRGVELVVHPLLLGNLLRFNYDLRNIASNHTVSSRPRYPGTSVQKTTVFELNPKFKNYRSLHAALTLP